MTTVDPALLLSIPLLQELPEEALAPLISSVGEGLNYAKGQEIFKVG